MMRRTLTAIPIVLSALAASPVSAGQVSKAERHCMAVNMYFEARDQTAVGQIAVGFVVLNRVASKHFPNTICKVVWQRKQFSWTWDGKSDKPKEKAAWAASLALADIVLSGKYSDPTNGALFYHATYAKPYWTKAMVQTVQLGTHIFYEKGTR